MISLEWVSSWTIVPSIPKVSWFSEVTQISEMFNLNPSFALGRFSPPDAVAAGSCYVTSILGFWHDDSYLPCVSWQPDYLLCREMICLWMNGPTTIDQPHKVLITGSHAVLLLKLHPTGCIHLAGRNQHQTRYHAKEKPASPCHQMPTKR